MSKKALLLSMAFLMALTLSTPLAQAYVYSGYDRTSIWILWFRVQKWELWVKIDTSADTWNVVWKKTGGWPYTSVMYAWPISKLKVWDDRGFGYTFQPIPESGEITFRYTNTYTWTHTEVQWPYMVTGLESLIGFEYKVCRVDIYVGS